MEEILHKINQIGEGIDDERILEDVRVDIFKKQLQRLVIAINIFTKIETRLLDEVDNMELKDLINVEKAMVKTIDNIQSLLRQFEPSLANQPDIKQLANEFSLSDKDNPKDVMKKVIINLLVSLLNETHQIQQGLTKYKQGSINHWKTTESLKSLTEVIKSLAKTLEDLSDEDELQEGITVKDIIEKYEKFVEHLNDDMQN